MPERPLLEIEDVRRRFGGLHAVDGAGFEVRAGTVTALIGPNGAGKTTLFNVVSGFLRPDSGRIAFEGRDIAGRAPHTIARRGLVRTFQLTRVLAKMKVLDNMMLAAPDQPGEKLYNALFRPMRSRRREREARTESLELLERVGLASHANEYAATLSGGQRKLLELARALMARPTMVMLDEPMAGVNPTLGRRLLVYLDELRDEQGLTVLFVEHDMEVVMGVSDEVVVMSEGRVIAQGSPDAVRTDPRVIDAYLGAEPAPA
jgi:branched-chain amino acid transport system ATP-binding protein